MLKASDPSKGSSHDITLQEVAATGVHRENLKDILSSIEDRIEYILEVQRGKEGGANGRASYIIVVAPRQCRHIVVIDEESVPGRGGERLLVGCWLLAVGRTVVARVNSNEKRPSGRAGERSS